MSERKKSSETWSVSPVPTWTYTKQGFLCQESLPRVLTVLVGVGVTDHRRVLPRLPHHGEAVGRVRPRRRPAVGPAAARAGSCRAGAVPAQHQTVEIKPDLETSQITSESRNKTRDFIYILWLLDIFIDGV